MAAVLLPESLNREILAELRRLAFGGAGLNDMIKHVQERLGFAPDFIVPVFPYFCKAFSLPLVEVLPIREYSNRDIPEMQSLLNRIRNAAISQSSDELE